MSRPIVYAETFGNPSEVWMWRQVRAAATPVLTHEYRNPDTFPHEPVWELPKRRAPLDRVRALGRLARGGHGYRLPDATQSAVIDRLRTEGATLIHAHFGPAGLRMLPVARELGIPLVVTFHGYDVTSLPAQDPAYRRALTELFETAWCVAVSGQVRALLQGLGCRRVRVLPLGTPIGERVPRKSGGALRLVTVARLVALKGIPDLVEAVRSLDAEVELHVVGEGPDRAAIEARAAGDPRVVLHGSLPPEGVARQLADADLFVLNSRGSEAGAIEGFGISVLEAMAAGLPVVATRHGGIPESVVHDETGLLVAERDTVGLGQAIESMVRDADRRKRMGEAGRRRVEEHFELGACTQRLLEFYAELSPVAGPLPPAGRK